MAESWVGARLLNENEVTRVIADQVEMLASRGGNTKGLLHENIGLVLVSVRAFFCSVISIVVATSTLWHLPRSS